MGQKKKRKGRLLCMVVLLAVSLTLSAGTVYARYSGNGAVRHIAEPVAKESFRSDLLSADGQTVVLSDWHIPMQTASQETENTQPPAETEPTELTPPQAETEPAEAPPPQTETEPQESQPPTTPTVPEEPKKPITPRSVSFTVSDANAAAADFTVEGDSYLTGELAVANGAATLILRPTDAVYALQEAVTAKVRVAWQGLSAELTVKLTQQEAGSELGGCSATMMASALRQYVALRVKGAEPTVTINMQGGADAANRLRCSFNGGTRWVKLWDTNQFTFTPAAEWNGLILLDLSETGLLGGGSDLRLLIAGVTEVSPIDALPTQDISSPFFLTMQQEYLLKYSPGWLGCDFRFTLEKLAKAGTGVQWQEVQNPEGLRIVASTEGLKLALENRETMFPAGSYRLVLRWSGDNVVVYESAVPFFVNYE